MRRKVNRARGTKREYEWNRREESLIKRRFFHTLPWLNEISLRYTRFIDPADIPTIFGIDDRRSPADLVAMKRGDMLSRFHAWAMRQVGIFWSYVATAQTEYSVDLCSLVEHTGRLQDVLRFTMVHRDDEYTLKCNVHQVGVPVLVIPYGIGAEADWREPNHANDRATIPHAVWLAAQARLMVLPFIEAANSALVVRETRSGEPQTYTVTADSSGQSAAMNLCWEFWLRFMDGGERPVPIQVGRSDFTLDKSGLSTIARHANSEEMELIGRMRRAQAATTAAATEIAECEPMLAASMGTMERLTDPISGEVIAYASASYSLADQETIASRALTLIEDRHHAKFRASILNYRPARVTVL